MGIINVSFVLRSLKGSWYGNWLIWGIFANIKFDCIQSLHFETEWNIAICIRALTSAMMQIYRLKISWTFSSVPPEIRFLICVYLCGYWAKISLRSSFVALAFVNIWTVEMSMGTFKVAMDDTNLVGFYPVLLQLMRLSCSQQASVSTRVNSSTSTRDQHVCVSLPLARGDTATPDRLHARLCHTFLVRYVVLSRNRMRVVVIRFKNIAYANQTSS